MPSALKLRATIRTKMNFKAFTQTVLERANPVYGAGPAGFKRLMRRLGNPQNSYQIIHVAGTNGKGSVCYLFAEILKAAGHKTGLFISPHLHSLTERIQLNGRKIARADIMRLCGQVLAAEEEKLNFFEIITAAAFLYYAEKEADWVVLETGLGGGKDPTNSCKPAACIISSVGLDHCKILGNTLVQIAREKAGIIKRGVPVFCPQLPPDALREIGRAAEQKRAALRIVKEGQPFGLAKVNWQKSDMILRNGAEKWPLHLLGEKQVQNACLVYQVCRALQLPEKAIKQGFARVKIPARFEVVSGGKKTVIFDGAHNPQAMENLVKFLQKSPWTHDIAVVCGFMNDKDYPAMLRLLSRASLPLYIAQPPSLRAATFRAIKSALPRGVKVKYYGSAPDSITQALKDYPAVLVTGSFYLVASVRACLRLRVRKKD